MHHYKFHGCEFLNKMKDTRDTLNTTTTQYILLSGTHTAMKYTLPEFLRIIHTLQSQGLKNFLDKSILEILQDYTN